METTDLPPKEGPSLTGGIAEVQGIFPSDASLQDAIARLTLLGFDRADLSLPTASPRAGDATPDIGAATPNTDIDAQQLRTLGTSGAGAVAAIAAAGITIATGGLAAVAIGAAVLAGGAAAGVTAAATSAGDVAQSGSRDAAAAAGQLVLSARITDAGKQAAAEGAMREAGASRVEALTRSNAGLDTTV